MDIHVSHNFIEIPAIDFEPRGRGKEGHGGKRSSWEKFNDVRT
jgi:hypothetical protein